MGRAFKVFIVFIALALLALAVYVLPSLFFRPGDPGYEPVFGVGEERYPLLATLSYTLVGARGHAQWIWSMLREFDQDDPAVAPYLRWLRWALADIRVRPHVYGDYVAVDTPVHRKVLYGAGWYVEPAKQGMLPANGSKVRMGFVRMPFGYGIVVTAYQDGNGQIIIVVHGTVVDEWEAERLATYGVAYREPYYYFRTILTARLIRIAVCEGASTSTAMSASLFGYPAIVSVNGSLLHEISGYLRLSSMGKQGAIQLPVDVDGDGVLDSYDVLKDIAMLPLSTLRELRQHSLILPASGLR